MQLMMNLINLIGSSQRYVEKLKLIYGILYRVSVSILNLIYIKTSILQLDLL